MPQCPICQSTFEQLRKHLVNAHSVKNVAERRILLNLTSGRVNIRHCPCPVRGCSYAQSRLDKHILDTHTEMAINKRASSVQVAKLRQCLKLLRELQGTNPTPEVSTAVDLLAEVGEEDITVETEEPEDEQYNQLDELEVTRMDKQVNEAMVWMNSKMNQQKIQDLNLDPVVKVQEIKAKTKSLLVKTETTADLNVFHEQKSQSSTEEHERHVEDLHKRHEQEKNQLTEKFQDAENILKGEVEELRAELQVYNELKKRAEDSTFNKDLQRNIQDQGSPGAFWESEQEPLVFVIEMKSERVHEQSRKLQQMEDLVGSLSSLEDQIINILQQNEDLRVRIDNCQTLTQQLLKEQHDLKVALERQAEVNQKLSQEKEQLMFKLRHRDSCPTLHLPVMVHEIAPR
ncbi:coiled-coil domain-containing protein 69-like [Hippoglossus hippoglossus]|uniref:coiled-coil domain-containing protein 69-like n=1 Tax=Hippoglossus hippoglossus TaxID=8267 RepID=UPI00148E4E0C|nr:coiled-coil domain-containing protein 69-like [Hippoglossus hippoglossus]